MILADTSIWIGHLRRGDERLAQLLEAGQVLTHPHVIGELALGSLKNRRTVLEALQNLPAAPVARDDEVLAFIDANALFGLGIGYIDGHLLAATRLAAGTTLWTRDRRLHEAATRLRLAQDVAH
ncbi:MAG: type II toxin-antitoxin system VapC family toxin [Methyloversatilis sp.]|uniref:type II toxin-antitoxin system VapC family toxin n=1 Tax=Methyloversatilis sp. TaxID=2569862 RepID=UPI0027362FA7|nr:type II toxin-antitoxin system VapC family toxin [Methyloversatilis sp.]MDP3873349.1 type II toxin-antitoxin system VapC family toxin [Methyloversatilis sp.]